MNTNKKNISEQIAKYRKQISEIKKQIDELKKQKLLEILQPFIAKQEKKRGAVVLPNPNSKFRNTYLTYLRWRKKYPKQLPSLKEILKKH